MSAMQGGYSPRLYPEAVNIKIKETKAPTDESIRLLNEMQEKTLENILGSIKLRDNNFFGQIEVYKDYRYNRVMTYLQFSWNGNRHKVELSTMPYAELSLEEKIKTYTEQLSVYIAKYMLSEFLRNITYQEQELLIK